MVDLAATAQSQSDSGGELRYVNELGEFPEVLGGGGEEELVLGTAWTT
jgi:hypothetical protein